ncbi:MAG: alcohol dehydrogenase catalytic domain-containing protein [Candidatus Limnocylindrales bacterium]
MNQKEPAQRPLPATEHAMQIVDVGRIVHNRNKAVPLPGPHQVVVQMEACGLCFSDTKLLHAFSSHPRKSVVLSGLDAGVLAEIPSYVPEGLPTVPGHEPVGRIVAAGDQVRRHRVGERCLIQTDYRQLTTVAANAAFGYNFEGGLQQYVVLDERVIIEPGTNERFLIPVGEEPSASAVALVEPWACVEASYVYRERRQPLPGGRLLLVADAAHRVSGIAALIEQAGPARVTAVLADTPQQQAVTAAFPAVAMATDIAALPRQSYDDIVYFGADAGRIEALQDLLAFQGIINIVTGGVSIGRPIALDIGRVHYDLTRWIGTSGQSTGDGYTAIPADGELRAGDRMAVIGAAGPMGLMHVVRAASAGWKGLSITALDIDEARLEHLGRAAGQIARSRGVGLEIVNSASSKVAPGFSYIALMVPAPPLVGEAVALAGPGGRINIFAGFASGTRARVDLDSYLERHCYLLGTSGSGIPDMKAVLHKLESGELDTNISLDAVAGFEGVADALAAIEGRTAAGKIMVYPSLPELGLVRLAELGARFPSVAAALDDGRWTKEAEQELLRVAGGSEAPA